MIGLVVIFAAVAVAALVRLVQLERGKREDSHVNHAICTAHVASVVSNRVIAIVLRDLADTWGTIENQAELKRLVREQWIEDGPSIPALWLYEKARLIEEGK